MSGIYEDGPAFVFERTKRIRHARRSHKCDWCGRSINPGQGYVLTVTLEDGDRKPTVSKHHSLTCEPAETFHD